MIGSGLNKASSQLTHVSISDKIAGGLAELTHIITDLQERLPVWGICYDSELSHCKLSGYLTEQSLGSAELGGLG